MLIMNFYSRSYSVLRYLKRLTHNGKDVLSCYVMILVVGHSTLKTKFIQAMRTVPSPGNTSCSRNYYYIIQLL